MHGFLSQLVDRIFIFSFAVIDIVYTPDNKLRKTSLCVCFFLYIFFFFQTRGSIPLYWSQRPNLKYKPLPLINKVANHVCIFHAFFIGYKQKLSGIIVCVQSMYLFLISQTSTSLRPFSLVLALSELLNQRTVYMACQKCGKTN